MPACDSWEKPARNPEREKGADIVMESIELTTTKSLTTGRMVGLTEVGRKRALSTMIRRFNRTDRGIADSPLGSWKRFGASSMALTQPAVRGLRFPPGIPSDW